MQSTSSGQATRFAIEPNPDNLNRSSCYFRLVTACTGAGSAARCTTHNPETLLLSMDGGAHAESVLCTAEGGQSDLHWHWSAVFQQLVHHQGFKPPSLAD